MSYISLEMLDPFSPPKRVLNFDKYKGWTIPSVHSKQPGYLAWCQETFGKPFMDELDCKETNISSCIYCQL